MLRKSLKIFSTKLRLHKKKKMRKKKLKTLLRNGNNSRIKEQTGEKKINRKSNNILMKIDSLSLRE